jgi:hypothetical protein
VPEPEQDTRCEDGLPVGVGRDRLVH